MFANKERAYFLDAFLKVALIFNITILLVGMVLLFFTTDTYGVYAASICSASALFNSIGLTLLMRWHHVGALFVVIASILSAAALSITCAGWLTFSFGDLGKYLPFAILMLYLATLFALLFLKHKGMSAWQQMDSSFDPTHFRHIYQLSAFILLIIFGVAIFVLPPTTESTETDDDDMEKVIENVSEARLDSPDVTIEEVVSFEKEYNKNNSVEKRDNKIINRIYALKHLLLSGLMPEIHNRDNLVNICMIHADAFSEEQQEIIDWYLSLDISQQSEWNVCDKANSLSEFKEIIQNKIR